MCALCVQRCRWLCVHTWTRTHACVGASRGKHATATAQAGLWAVAFRGTSGLRGIPPCVCFGGPPVPGLALAALFCEALPWSGRLCCVGWRWPRGHQLQHPPRLSCSVPRSCPLPALLTAEPGLQGWEALQVTSKAPGTLAAAAGRRRCPCTASGLGVDGLAAPPSRGAASPVRERHHQSGFFQHGVGEDGRVARPRLPGVCQARPPHPLRPVASSVPGHTRQLVASSAAAFAKLPKPGA